MSDTLSTRRAARLLACGSLVGFGIYAIYLALLLLVRHNAPATTDYSSTYLPDFLYLIATFSGVVAFWVTLGLVMAAKRSRQRPIKPMPPWLLFPYVALIEPDLPKLPLLALFGPAVSVASVSFAPNGGFGPHGSWPTAQCQLFFFYVAVQVALPALAPLTALWMVWHARPSIKPDTSR